MIGFDNKLTQNLMRILILIVLVFFSLARAQQTPLVVTDVKKGNFKMQKSRFTYDDAYIINENYVVFQKDNTRKTFTVDGNSFRVYDDDFSLDKNGVYYQGKLIPTDTTGFKILIYKSIPKEGKDKYAYTLLPIWKTQQGVFIETKLIKDIDPLSVETIKNSYYLKDKKHLYYYDKLVAGAEVENLMEAFANDEIISDSKTVYYGGTPLHYQREKLTQVNRRIFKTPTKVLFFSNCYDNTFLELLPYFDIPTLKALNDSYVVDKNHIYKPVDYISVNKNTYLAVPNVKKELLNKIKFFPKGRFFSDTENIYFDGIIQKHYDAATFNILTDGENYYQYDKNGIYNFTYKLDFNYTEPVQLGKNTFFVKEKLVYLNQVFDFTLGGGSYYHSLTEEELEKIKQGGNIEFIDGKLVVIPASHKIYGYQKRGNKVYYNNKLQNVDVVSFEEKNGFYTDKNYVYFPSYKGLVPVKGYDIASLRKFWGSFLIDKNYLYWKNQRLIENENVELLAVYAGYRMQCSQDRTPSSNYYLLKNKKGYYLLQHIEYDKLTLQYIGTDLIGFNL
jgi:hypothetical protein